MGIDAELRSESGAVLESVADAQNVLSKAQGLLSGTRLLCYLVPWGDAIFNQAQASDLSNDISEVCSRNESSAVAEHLKKISPLVERLSKETHQYLWFVGD